MIRLLASHPSWLLGCEDEVWFSRLARPSLHAWSEPDQPLPLQALTAAKEDPDPKAPACDGLLVRSGGSGPAPQEEIWLRFVTGRPISAVTTQFLAWCVERAARAGKTALLLVWDNAAWPLSAAVRAWIKAHNRAVKQTGQGVRLLVCALPSKSPWLNPIEPKWVHGKRRVVAPDRLLSATELEERVYAAYGCHPEPRLVIPEHVS